MGIMFGPRRAAPQPEQRAMTLAQLGIAPASMNYDYSAGVADANGLGALQAVAVGAATDLIASLASELPVHVYRDVWTDSTGRDTPKQIPTPGNIEDPGADQYGVHDWVYSAIASWLYRGNLYAEKAELTIRNQPRALLLMNPDDVSTTIRDGRGVWLVGGREFPAERMFHARAYSLPGRLLGASPIERHALQIGVTLSGARYGAAWFRDGAHPSALLTNSEVDLDATQAQTIKDRWRAIFNGRREPAVMGRGWDYKPLQLTPEQSQFLESMRFNAAECARIFGPGVPEVLGYETGGSMTYANVVDRRADLLALTLDKWINRVERILTSLLPSPQYVRLDRDALLRSTTLARYEAHASAIGAGWKTVDEVRDDEDLPPLGQPTSTGGDGSGTDAAA